jgi:hypothetical protein
MSFITLIAISFLIHSSICEIHDGHLKKFGSSGPFVQMRQLSADESISTSRFFADHVEKKVPLLFKGEALKYKAFELWSGNDDSLVQMASEHADYEINIETVKKESRDQTYRKTTLLEFLRIYKTSDIYMVDDVPVFLKQFVPLPTPLQCGQGPETLEQTIMWFSSGGTKSVTHTDDYENILCLFSGRKTFTLIDSYEHAEALNVSLVRRVIGLPRPLSLFFSVVSENHRYSRRVLFEHGRRQVFVHILGNVCQLIDDVFDLTEWTTKNIQAWRPSVTTKSTWRLATACMCRSSGKVC